MSKQPETLRLADAIERLESTGWGGDQADLTTYSQKQAELAATELRRLHEVNQELFKAAKLFQDYMRFMDAQDDIKGMLAFAELVEVNAAAIAKAEGDEK